MALTQITTDGIKNGTISTADLADQSITLAKLPHGTSSNDGKFLRANNGADPTFETVNTDLVSDTSPQLGGDLASNGNDIDFADNDKATFGTGEDLKIYHESGQSYIQNSTGNFRIDADALRLRSKTGNEAFLSANVNGAVEIYHDNSKKFETKSYGALVTGYISANPTSGDLGFHAGDNTKMTFGAGDDLQIFHDGSHSHLNNVTGNLLIGVEGEFQVLNRQENEFRIRAHNNGGVDLYYDHTKRFETSPTGATVTGNLTTTGHVHIPDNFRLKVGNATNGDLILIHDGTDSIIDNASGNLFIRSDSLHLQSTAGENMVVGEANGAVEIYHNNSKKAETVSTGFKVGNQLSIGEAVINLEKSGTHHHRIVGNDTGGDLGFQQSSDNGSNTNFTTYLRINDGGNISLPVDSQVLNLGASQDMQLYHNGTDSYILNATNNLRIGNYNNNNLKFFTSNSTRWEINGSGHFLPDSNNSFDIGSTSKRVRNIYTNDLNLSNEGGANDVDMTWGSYTIQEGHNDLFLINKRTGKKYKFNLTEVS